MGIICIDKESGITSFGVVAKVRGITGIKKVGHTGTLDPMATGVLPVLLGGATKFLNFLPESDKGYRASFILGKTTDTLDITGTVTGEYPVTVGKEEIKAILPSFVGTVQQVPPMFSAKSVDGVRLYALAQQGKEVERTPCTVEIKRLDFVGEENGEYTVDVLCSKGTYIRSLIDDLGKALGCGAVMTKLERTLACGFTKADCVTLAQLQELKDSGAGFDSCTKPLATVFDAYPKVSVTSAQTNRFQNGGALDILRIKNPPKEGELCTVYSPEGVFLGLGKHSDAALKIARLYIR